MRKILILTLLIITVTYSYSQDEWRMYTPTGDVISKGGVSIKGTAELHFNQPYYTSHSIPSEANSPIYVSIFKPFTDTPLFVVGKKATKYEIESALRLFDINDWFSSMYYKHLLNDMIDDEHLTDLKLYEYFGKPTSIEESRSKQIYIYKNIRTEFEVIGGLVRDYVIKN